MSAGKKSCRVAARAALRTIRVTRQEEGYVLILVMLVLLALGLMSVTLLAGIQVNQQHVSRDRNYTQSLAVAEAGLNQYLWMVFDGKANEANNFVIPATPADPSTSYLKTFNLNDVHSGALLGTYTMTVTPPFTVPSDSRIRVKVTGRAASSIETPRTVEAHIGRPSFSEYVLLVDKDVYIGGAPLNLDRQWFGKTHSNTGIRIETRNISDFITSALPTYQYSSGWKDGVWSQYVPTNDPKRLQFWSFPVPRIEFGTVSTDFSKLSTLITGAANLPYAPPTQSGRRHGWYIKLSETGYQVARVSDEGEGSSYTSGDRKWGKLIYGTNSPSYDNLVMGSAIPYTNLNKGVIYVNDNVWIEGTNVDTRITIASCEPSSGPGVGSPTSINIIGDLTYHDKADGSCAIGLIAEQDVKIPMYAPYMKSGSLASLDMEIDCALIAQKGKEYVNFTSSGPLRDTLTIFGSVSSFDTPYRALDNGSAGFLNGANSYDTHLLKQPPPHFPTVGSYQILDWRELPLSASTP